MTPVIDVRPAVLGDAPALHAVAVAAIRRSAAGHYTAAEREAWVGRLDVAQHERIIAEQHAVVAVLDGAVAGFASIALDPAGDLDRGEVDRLFVSPDHGGRGVASALLGAVEAAARAAGVPALVTHASWRAEPVFARHGYVEEAVERVAIDGETLTRARMRKVLADESGRTGRSGAA